MLRGPARGFGVVGVVALLGELGRACRGCSVVLQAQVDSGVLGGAGLGAEACVFGEVAFVQLGF